MFHDMTLSGVLVHLVYISLVLGGDFNALEVRYGNHDRHATDGYYALPWSVTEANQGERWQRAGYDKHLKVELYSHVDDPRFFLLFDQYGTIAGVRFGFLKKDAVKSKKLKKKYRYQFPKSMFKSGKAWQMSIWHTTVIFMDPDKLSHGGRPHLDRETDDIIDALYFWGDKRWQKVPKVECFVPKTLVAESCFAGMGQHYYYKTDVKTVCKNWQGFFATYDKGLLVGFGVSVFGSFLAPVYSSTQFYEYPSFEMVKMMLPSRPQCLDDWLPLTGLTSIHVFLKDSADSLACPQVDWRTTNCPKVLP